MKSKTANFLFAFLCVLLCMPISAKNTASQRKQLFDSSWRFTLDSIADLSDPAVDDSSWKTVNLPHDWSVEGEFDENAPMGNDGGYFPSGTGWYRKTFVASKADEGKKFRLYFEGVYMDSEVYVNGHKVGGHPYGFSSFYCDITPYLKYGQKNVIAVKADNSKQKNCRWYSGSGIYRHVWLMKTPQTHIDEWSVFARPVFENGKWNLIIDAQTADSSADTEFAHTLLHKNGKAVAEVKGAGKTLSMPVENPALWSPENPNLYTVRTQLLKEGKVVDEVTNITGFRTIEYDAHSGLRLNGKPLILNGGCAHHDNGVLGAKSFNAAEARKVALLKQAGFNAVRTSHNPPSEAFLDECDRQGLLVIDEAFDGWRDAKNKHDYSTLFDQWWEADIDALVKRDRNHPSIFCWSTGNEVIERKKLEVVKTARKLADRVRSLDPSRPVTSALTTWDSEWDIFDPLAAVHDIVGYNYQLHRAESDHERVTDRLIMQTESYPNDAFKNWKTVNGNPYVIGDFVWTALDYLGESSIGRAYYKGKENDGFHTEHLYPWHGAYCGDIDVTGLRKPISHYRDLLYNTDKKLYMAVREPNRYRGEIKVTDWGVWPTYESWTWPGHEGKDIEVEVISRYPKVRLMLNDKVVGEKNVSENTEFKAVFAISYSEGTLTAVGLDKNGTEKEAFTLKTAETPYAIRLTADKASMNADGQDLVFVVAEIVDRNGTVVPDADDEIVFSIAGPGAIEATGNADMKDETSYSSHSHKAWKGRAMAVVRASDKGGKITLRANSPKLPQASVQIKAKYQMLYKQ